MKILKLQALKGPNIWSVTRRRLIQMRLDLEDLENHPTNTIDGFLERIKNMFPSMYSHRCSEGVDGGFFHRVERGTWMGHVIEHIALEIQTLAGMDTGFGRTRSTRTHGIYNVVFSYVEEEVGMYAAEAAVRIAEALIHNTPYDLENDIQKMREIREEVRLGPSTGSIVQEAIARDIPFKRLGTNSLVQLGYGKNQVRFQATITQYTSNIAVDIACDKKETKRMLDMAAIPVPKGDVITRESSIEEVVQKIGFPVVVKPVDGNHGKGGSINLTNIESVIAAFHHAQKYSNRVIIEKFITGYDFRVLVINHTLVAAAKRTPANVFGDGIHTIQQLIDTTNKDPRRGYGHENVLTQIAIDRDLMEMLAKKNYTLDTVPSKGEEVFLKSTANLSTGGTSVDITDIMHPENIFMCERISRVIGLDICGIDIMAPNLTEPIKQNGGAILEVNAAPGFRMHLAPSEGLPRNVAAPVIDMLYPPGKSFRIPIIAVTGTNGKTTTTRLIAHMVKNNGYHVGYTTSDGIYVQNTMLEKGDTTGPFSAEFILKDPTVDFAVLECARGGILRSGLGFGRCDIGIVTNIQADHLGLNDIDDLDDLRRVKGVIPRSVKRDGYSILNAEDPNCVKLSEEIDCKIAYFSMNENHPVILEHAAKNGISCVYENGFITIKKGEWKFRVVKVTNVPLTFGGRAGFMISNCLAATLAGYLQGFTIENLKMSLETFVPGAAQTPGRMNIFQFKNFSVMIDFAHNPHGYKAINEFLKKIDAPHKIGIISGVGDRRDEDIIECAAIAADMFDHIIIRQEKHLRGRSEQELIDLLVQGIKSVKPNMTYDIVPKEVEALKHAMNIAQKETFIVALSDVITNAIEVVQNYLDKEAGL